MLLWVIPCKLCSSLSTGNTGYTPHITVIHTTHRSGFFCVWYYSFMQSNNNHLTQWLYDRGISDEVLRLFNIQTDYEHPLIGTCIRIPFSDTHSKYRRDPLSDQKPKYLYDAGGKVTLYGVDKLKEQGSILITEGELDTLVAWSKNIPAVSSTGGAMSFQEGWVDVFGPQDKVYLCFDNDDAGAEGMVRVLNYIPDAFVVLIPETPGVKDISDYVSRGGDLHSLLTTAKQFPSISAVEADKALRHAQWQSTRFHDKYLDAKRQQHERATRTSTHTYDGNDEVLRAKTVPMTDFITFKQRKACCPWHSDSTPSLQYYPKTNSAYCFGGCGRAYDVIDAYRHKHNGTFLNAISELNKML